MHKPLLWRRLKLAGTVPLLALTIIGLTACDPDEGTSGSDPTFNFPPPTPSVLNSLCWDAMIDALADPTSGNQFWQELVCRPSTGGITQTTLQNSLAQESRAGIFCGAIEVGGMVAPDVVEYRFPQRNLWWIDPLLEVAGLVCPAIYLNYLDDIFVALIE